MTKTKLSSCLLLMMLVIVLIISSIMVLTRRVLAEQEVSLIQSPTIFIPGTNGTNHRFDSLIDELKQSDVAINGILKVYVKKNGDIRLSGKLSQRDQEPLIVVGFEDNSEGAVDDQGRLFQHVLMTLAENYQFNDYQVVGHSNGGLTVTAYLANYHQVSDPILTKLVTIGTPFTDEPTSETGLNFVKKRSLPIVGSVLAIAGDLDGESDGVVTVASALGAREIYQDVSGNYEELVVTGDLAGHSYLVTNPKVVKKMIQELF